jgi:hypothetical protein|tara:strand:- start:2634 stop:2900 length:267 start_codon:yes stop_codon:yes gene_type:complete
MGVGLSGVGMLGKKADAAEVAMDKLKSKLPQDFTPEQLEALEEVMDAWTSVKGFLTVMRYAGATLKWCVAFALGWAAFKAGLFGAFAK